MNTKQPPIAALLVIGGALLFLVPQAIKFGGNSIVPALLDNRQLEGSTLFLVNEKLAPTVNEVLAVRDAPDFVTQHKLAGFVHMDKDEESLSEFLKEVKDKHKIEPPLLVIQKSDGGKSQVVRVRKWVNGLEDILK